MENQSPGGGAPGPKRQDEPPAGSFRAEVLGRMTAWVDEILGEESPPAGVQAEQLAAAQRDVAEDPEGAARVDLFSLWSAVVALTQETRLQGRAFKELHERLGGAESLAEAVASLRQAREESLSAARAAAGDAEAQRQQREDAARQAGRDSAERQALDALLDVRDRLVRGQAAARAALAGIAGGKPRRRWLDRLRRGRSRPGAAGAEAVEAMAKGYDLALARLDDHLEGMGVGEIECAGRAFDHRTMAAVDVEYTLAAAEGTVLAVYRAGYQRHGRVLRAAEVQVARRPGAAPGASKEADDD